MTQYQEDIRSRSLGRYLRGLLVRWWQHCRYECICRIARRRGATIGQSVVMPLALARRANANLVVGDHTSIQTDQLDLNAPLHIGSHVIIGAETRILTSSHDIDAPSFALKTYGLTIEDYVWLPTSVLVLPACRHIGQGAVVGSGSVVVRDVEPMTVVGGNPAVFLRRRQSVHSELVVESLLGGDFEAYRTARTR